MAGQTQKSTKKTITVEKGLRKINLHQEELMKNCQLRRFDGTIRGVACTLLDCQIPSIVNFKKIWENFNFKKVMEKLQHN